MRQAYRCRDRRPTFIHSGLTGLINITYNASPATVIIADNSITGMTGHQPNPATGVTIKNQQTNAVNLEEAVRACGVRRVRVVDPYDTDALRGRAARGALRRTSRPS